VINVGTGQGATVLELTKTFEVASEQPVAFEIAASRLDDVAASLVDPSKAKRLLGWQAEHNLKDICDSAWKWQSQNPNVYGKIDH